MSLREGDDRGDDATIVGRITQLSTTRLMEKLKIERRLADEARAAYARVAARGRIEAAFALIEVIRPGHFKLGIRRPGHIDCCVCDAITRYDNS